MLYRLVVLVLLLTPIAIAAPSPASCPPLPSTCSCEPGNSGMLLVSCEGAILPSLFRDLGALPLEQLRITKCSQPNLDVLPKGPIHSLEISECGIQRIDSKIFANTVNMIEEIILSNNSLTEVPDFGTLPRLVNLDLNGNKISSVPDRVFAGIQNIQQLRMERNNICSLSDKAFVEVKNSLRLLDLSGNCLSKVPAVNLRNSQKLMFLDLADNDISEIKDFELMNMPLLQEIRLNNNELRSLQPRAIMNVPQLKYLFIRDNLLSSLDGDKLQELSQLEVLDVTNNRLPKVPKLKNFPKLKQVLLDDNRIEQIDELTFSNCTQLQLISLQNNNIARVAGNSFDTLDQMQVLLLGNNSLSSIDRGTLDGMRSLAFLHARNNSISKIDPHAFTSVLNLHSIDLAHNALKTIEPKTFQNLGRLMWLDVSNNHLQGFEKDTFNQKIETMLLDGNEWVCDEKFDWFVTFLVTNRVRTFLPQQNEIQCSGPAQYQGVRLRDLMVRKANDTITEGMKTLGLDKQGQKSLISSFIPGLETWNQAVSAQQLGNMASGIPILNTITQAIPSLRTLPLMGTSQTGAQPVPQHRNLNNAIEQFTAPIVRFATGGQPVASDVSQFIQSIPNFVVNIPGFGDFDLSKINPDLVDFVLQGNTVPGVPKETMDGIIQNYMKKVYSAAAAAKAGKLTKDQKKYLLPMNQLPKKMVQNVMAGQLLPGLTEDQTRTVTEYYATAGSPASVSSAAAGGSTSVNTAAMADLWKLLPPDYNISKIPQEVIGAVMKGELPDLKQLPTDLMAHFQANADKMASMFAKLAPANVTLDDLLAKLPRFEKPILATFSPYDINKLSSDMIHEEKIKETSEKMKLYTAIALGGIGGITIICCIFLVAYLMRHRLNKTRSPEESAPVGADETLLGTGEAASTPSTPPPRVVTTPGPPLANSTMRDPPQAEA